MAPIEPPPGYDPEVWNALPSEIQQELAAAADDAGGAAAAGSANAGTSSNSFSAAAQQKSRRPAKDEEPIVIGDDDSDDDVVVVAEKTSGGNKSSAANATNFNNGPRPTRPVMEDEDERLARELQENEYMAFGGGRGSTNGPAAAAAESDGEREVFDDLIPDSAPASLDWFNEMQSKFVQKASAAASAKAKKKGSNSAGAKAGVKRRRRYVPKDDGESSGTDSVGGMSSSGEETGDEGGEEAWTSTRLDENSVFIPKNAPVIGDGRTLGESSSVEMQDEAPTKPPAPGSPTKITDFFRKPAAPVAHGKASGSGSSSSAAAPQVLFRDPDFPPDVTSIDGRKDAPNSKAITGQTLSGEVVTEVVATDTGKRSVFCRCNQFARLKTVHKANENQGRQFWSCSKPRSQQCDFFMWAEGKAAASHTARDMNYEWKRLNVAQGFTLVHGAFDADDVLQGAIGDCWFVAALSVLSQRPDLVSRLFVDLGDPNIGVDGSYRLRLFMDGAWQLFTVDDYFPHRPLSDEKSGERKLKSTREEAGAPKLAFAKSSRKPGSKGWQIWAPLVEKAYAKANSCYRAITGGWVAEGLHDLSGFPTEVISFSHRNFDSELLWARMMAFMEHGLLVGAACMKSGDGLVGSHAYSVLEVRDVYGIQTGRQSKVTDFFGGSGGRTLSGSNKAGSSAAGVGANNDLGEHAGLRLVKVRNPWGCHPWTGAWSRKSEFWTPKLKALVGFNEKDDGSFWMSYEDFISRFYSIDVLHCHSRWQSGQKQFEIEPSRSIADRALQIRVNEPTWLYVSILQPGKRGRADERYWYADVSLLVIREREGIVTMVEQIRLSAPRRSAHLELMLDDPKATYHLFFFSIGREVGIRDPVKMTSARKRVVKLDQTVKIVARVFANKPLKMRRSQALSSLIYAESSLTKQSKKTANTSVKGKGKGPQVSKEGSEILDGFYAAVLSAIVETARNSGAGQQGFSTLGQPARVLTRILSKDIRLDLYEAAGMGIAVVENRLVLNCTPLVVSRVFLMPPFSSYRSRNESVRVRMLLHAGDEGATNLLPPKKPRSKPKPKAPQEPSGGYRLDGGSTGPQEDSADADPEAVEEDGRRWEYVGPNARAVVAVVPMPQAWEEEMLGYSQFALDRLEWETWRTGSREEFDEALDFSKARTFYGRL